MTLEYKEFWNCVNEEPTSYIQIFVSDWNKENFAFYAYINLDAYEEDIDQINELITKLNWQDQDVYIEMIDRSEDLAGFYKLMYDLGYMSNWEILNKEFWEILEHQEDRFFSIANTALGTTDLNSLQAFEDSYSEYEDYEELFENTQPELYEALEKANALWCFDFEQFFNCWSEITDITINKNGTYEKFIIYTYE